VDNDDEVRDLCRCVLVGEHHSIACENRQMRDSPFCRKCEGRHPGWEVLCGYRVTMSQEQ
jgi:hypothetical protein